MSTELVSRQHTPSSAPVTMGNESLSVELREATAIANAGELIPRQYRNNPGGVLLVSRWARHNGIDPFEALRGVNLISGNIDVGYAIRIQMASAKGFEFDVLASNRGRCIIQVVDRRGDTPVSRGEPIEVKIEDISKSDLNKQNWKENPDDMLFARAIRKADRRYVQTAAMVVEDSGYVEPPHVVDTAVLDDAIVVDEPADTAAEVETATVPPAPPPPAAHPDDVVDVPAVETPTAAELRDAAKAKGVRAATVMRTVQEMYPDAGLATFDDIADNRDAAVDLADWIDQQ